MKENLPWTTVIFNMHEYLVRLTTSAQHVPKQISWTGFLSVCRDPRFKVNLQPWHVRSQQLMKGNDRVDFILNTVTLHTYMKNQKHS